MDDAAAIARCSGGDQDAFRHLVEHYQAEAIAHAVTILGNREDARDAVQEAFVDAFGALRRFDAARPFYPWLYTILRNRCYKLVASRRRKEADPLPAGLYVEGSADETIAVDRALDALSREDRELLLLRHLDGLSYEELAQRLEIPIGTVMSRLFTARKRMRDKLTGRKEAS